MSGKGIMEDRTLIALGGLLHDIGKFVQRAIRKGFKFSECSVTEELGGKDENLEKDYGKEHAYLSGIFLKYLENEGIIDKDLKERLINWGAKHHKPIKDDLGSVISQVADWYSASERENKLGSCINLLHSIFERVSLSPKKEREHKRGELLEWNTAKELNCSELSGEVQDKPIKNTFGFYKLSPLSPEVDIFPRVFEGVIFVKKDKENHDYLIVPDYKTITDYRTITREEIEKYEEGYKELFEKFCEEIKSLKGLKLSDDQLFNYLYYLLYKYTWCVPASTYDTEKASRHYPDISLFDHSRVLSAIAVCLLDWAETENKKPEDIKPVKKREGGWHLPTDDEEVFLLVEGDIGGIQSFIYNIHKATSESKLSIAKALRGRSFFLTMLPEVIARYILREFKYPLTNALYIGGGKFQLILANTKDNRNKLESIEKEINRWMHREFQGELSISIACVPMKGKALRERELREDDSKNEPRTFLDYVEWLQLELDRKKKRKFGELLFEEFDRDSTSADNICPSCRTLYKRENDPLCKWCNISQEWGSILPKVRYIAFDWGENYDVKLETPRKIMNFGNFGKVYLLEEEDLGAVKELPEILNIEDTSMRIEENKIVNGFKFIGHATPRAPKDLLDLLNEIWKRKIERREEPEKEKLKEGEILPFDLLVEFAEGDKKLGFFRADVDFLGLIFSDGLRFNEFGDEEIYTISRVVTLSRMLDLFFTGYLNKLAEEVSRDYVKSKIEKLRDDDSQSEYSKLLESVLDNNGELKIGSLIYTVYSGGDDLFVIAPYDLAVEFATKLRERFREFTCKNPDFGLSGGIFIGRHNTPIHLVAKFAERLENKAKKARKEKDAIAIFEKAFIWSSDCKADEGVEEKSIRPCFEEKEDKTNGSKCSEKENNRELMKFSDIIELSHMLEEALKDKNISRGFLYKLLTLHKQYYDPVEDCTNLMIYPKICYYLGRNIKNEDVRKELAEALLEGMKGRYKRPNVIIRNLPVFISLALMKTRKGGE